MNTEFDVLVNFTRMYCNDPECPMDDSFNLVSKTGGDDCLGEVPWEFIIKPHERVSELIDERDLES
jgi:hypothetical protein